MLGCVSAGRVLQKLNYPPCMLVCCRVLSFLCLSNFSKSMPSFDVESETLTIGFLQGQYTLKCAGLCKGRFLYQANPADCECSNVGGQVLVAIELWPLPSPNWMQQEVCLFIGILQYYSTTAELSVAKDSASPELSSKRRLSVWSSETLHKLEDTSLRVG
jgi:hypothetical protein